MTKQNLHAAFTLADFVAQREQIRRLGPIANTVRWIPGLQKIIAQVEMGEADLEWKFQRGRAVYDSMTSDERDDPGSISASRRRRIARGAGTGVMEVSQFLTEFQTAEEIIRVAQAPRGNKLGRVLGLVTENKFSRDPSFLRRISNPWEWFVAGAMVLAWVLYLAQHHSWLAR